jgi:hypothetical protein
MVVACTALALAVGGTAFAGSLISGSSIRNGSITAAKLRSATLTGLQVRNGSLPGTKLRNDSVTGRQVNEATLVGVRPGVLVSRRMALNEQVVVFRAGPLALVARCWNDGNNDIIDVYAASAVPGAILEGQDERTGAPGLTLDPDLPEDQRRLLTNSASTGQTNVDNDADEGFVLAPDGTRISVEGDSATLGLNYLGAKCVLGFYAVADRI